VIGYEVADVAQCRAHGPLLEKFKNSRKNVALKRNLVFSGACSKWGG
jgi:hypothetical protein